MQYVGFGEQSTYDHICYTFPLKFREACKKKLFARKKNYARCYSVLVVLRCITQRGVNCFANISAKTKVFAKPVSPINQWPRWPPFMRETIIIKLLHCLTSSLKWQCHEIFWHFFISLIQPIWASDKQVKKVFLTNLFSRRYLNFLTRQTFKKLTKNVGLI